MRSKVSIILVVGFVAGLLSLTALAQAEEQKPQLFVVWDDIVHPSKAMEYEAAMKAWITFNTKYKFPHPVTVYRTNDYHYYTLMPIEKFADIDDLEKHFSELGEEAEKEVEELGKLFAGTFESETFGVIALRTDLSYLPENQRVKTEDISFVWWIYYYIKTGKEKEAEKIAKEWQALYKNKGITDYFNVYQPSLWSDLPVMVAAGGALSAADYYSHLEKNIEKMGDEYLALTKKTMDACRKFEQRTGMILRELSYIPPEK
jgi:hypothetical protein